MLTRVLKEAMMDNVDRYAYATMRTPKCYTGIDANGADHQVAAMSFGDASRLLSADGVDVTTIRVIPFGEANDVVQETCIALGNDEYRAGRAEAYDHYE